jgi:hypothetical protein
MIDPLHRQATIMLFAGGGGFVTWITVWVLGRILQPPDA